MKTVSKPFQREKKYTVCHSAAGNKAYIAQERRWKRGESKGGWHAVKGREDMLLNPS